MQLQIHDKTIDFPGINLILHQAFLDEQHSAILQLQIYQHYQHVLIDEFQDTSIHQFDILTCAFSSWQGEANRTITVVGDPMQVFIVFDKLKLAISTGSSRRVLRCSIRNLFLTRNYRSDKT